jgi:hypothetical protein
MFSADPYYSDEMSVNNNKIKVSLAPLKISLFATPFLLSLKFLLVKSLRESSLENNLMLIFLETRRDRKIVD